MLASILINNYNYADYLEKCIDSVLHQTYKDIEIIVYDDGSTDHSLEVLSTFSNITVIANENYGKNHNLNQMNAVYQAFLKSKGEYIFLLDSDDWFREDKVEKVINVFLENPQVEAIQHYLVEVDKYGYSTNAIVPVLKEVPNYSEHIFKTENLLHLFTVTSGLAFRRSFFDQVMPLAEDEKKFLCVDIRLMLHAAILSNIYTIFEPLSYYRRHGTNFSSKYSDPKGYEQFLDELYSFFNLIAKDNGLDSISYSLSKSLGNSFFFNSINLEKCNHFIDEDEFWIWGAGEAGQSIFYALQEKKQKCLGFIDRDVRKQNQIIMGKKVVSPESIDYKSEIKLLVSPYHVYNLINGELQLVGLSEGFHFIDPYLREN